MKVVISTDWHGDWVTAGVPRFDEIAKAVDASVRAAVDMKASVYIFAGDLSEVEGPGMLQTLALAVGVAKDLNRRGIQSVWLTGNHDVIEDGLGTSNLTPMAEVEGAELVDAPRIIPFADVAHHRGAPMPFGSEARAKYLSQQRLPPGVKRLACLPFTPRTHNYDPRAFVRDNVAAHPDLVVGHLMLEGIAAGSETTDMARGRDVFWPLAEIKECWPGALLIGGHYHETQVYQGVHLVGSLARLTRSELNNAPSYLVATI